MGSDFFVVREMDRTYSSYRTYSLDPLKIPPQVHSSVKSCDLFAVTVEK
jgi:hypothetical protein